MPTSVSPKGERSCRGVSDGWCFEKAAGPRAQRATHAMENSRAAAAVQGRGRGDKLIGGCHDCTAMLRPSWSGDSGVVGRRRDASAAAGPVGVEELPARLVYALVGVSTEEVALGLQEIRWKTASPVAVEEGECCGEGRHGNAELHALDDGTPPGALVLVDGRGEEVIEEEILELGIFVVGFLDLAEELAADNAAAAPHERDATHVEVPALLFAGFAQKHVTLRVADHLRAVESAAHVLDEACTVGDGRF